MQATVDIERAIARSWFGASIPPRVLGRFVALGHLRHVGSGTVILAEDAETRELGLVVTGRLALTEHVPGRGAVTLLTVESGDIYGWSVLVPPYRATSTVTAVEPTTVVTFPESALRSALAADAELARAVLARVLEAVARRLVATRHQLIDDYATDVDEPW